MSGTQVSHDEIDRTLARLPWGRLAKELFLFAALVRRGDEPVRDPSAPVRSALSAARAATWDVRRKPVWSFLTEHMQSALPAEARANAAREAVRILDLSLPAIEAELRARGVDLGVVGAFEADVRASFATQGARSSAGRSPNELRVPVLSPGQWAALALVVLVVAALAGLAVWMVRRVP